MITTTLCVATLEITSAILVAVCQRLRAAPTVLPVPNLGVELSACLGAIGILGGYIYNRGKTAEERKAGGA